MPSAFVDIHCHLLPGIDDGAADWATSLSMAEMAVADGIDTIIATPHQLGGYAGNRGDTIRQRVDELRSRLSERGLEIEVLPGADVRIEEELASELATGNVLTLAGRGRHVLLELPHELYFPLEPVLDELAKLKMVGVLSHPERNRGILANPELVLKLVDIGCLMQVTAGSLTGRFGGASRQLAEWMLAENAVHFIATDAHGLRSRRPRMSQAFQRIVQLSGPETARAVCCEHPAQIAAGNDVPAGRRAAKRKRRWSGSWFGTRVAS